MAKSKTIFICQNCGAQSPKWIGKCNSCNSWNTYQEEIVASKPTTSISQHYSQSPISLSSIQHEHTNRILSGIGELDSVIGGGFVPGSVLLLGGEPGVGKSTLLLQVAIASGKKVLYVSGEESPQQIALRAKRLDIQSEACSILNEMNVIAILEYAKKLTPELLIVDSVQTLKHLDIESAPGTVTQIRETSNMLIEYAKQTHTPLLLIGHITKEGTLAGPKVLEHMVDVVLQFEGDMHNVFRILRSSKNRFGSTAEIGIFEMLHAGLREVANPSEALISKNKDVLSGVTIAAVMEGMRPLFIEVQALVSTAAYGTPQRTVTGYDARRVSMLLAVIEKRLGIKVYTKDVFINITGGIKIQDTATDLAIITAIVSSLFDIPISPTICFCGEIGLTGEIRSVSHIERRIKEAKKIGIPTVYSPLNQHTHSKNNTAFSRIDEVCKNLFNSKKDSKN